MSCPHAHDDGAYLLGALSPSERRVFEQHLAECESCSRSVSELAGLPGLLGRVDPAVLTEAPRDDPLPETLLPALTREVRRSARRRTRAMAAALVAAAAAVVIGAVVVGGLPWQDRTPSGDPGSSQVLTEAMTPVGEVPVRAELTVQDVSWGTRLGLTCTYEPDSVDYELPPQVDYWLVVKDRDGSVEQIGSWRSVDGETMRFTAGTATGRDDIASVEVRAPGGRVVLRSRL